MRRDGVTGATRAVCSHVVYRYRRFREDAIDRRFGTDSGGYIPLASLAIDSPNVEHGVHFEPVTRRYFERMLAAAEIELERFTFVDLGCGKGRALLFAAGHRFPRVVGVEFSRDLVAVARDNVRAFLAKTGEGDRFEVRQEDAADFAFPPDPIVLFLYNPFGEPVLARVVENLQRSFERNPREVVVLYRTPRWAHCFDALPFLAQVAAEDGYRVYRSVVPAAA